MYILFTLISFSLFAQNYELEAIVYSDKIQSNYQETTQDIKIIQKENFKNEKTLEDVLRNIPGVVIKRSAGVSSFRYRGLPSRYTLILVNGKRVYDAAGIDEGFNLDSIDISMLDRIEIINGTSALAYGSGSYASVINLITANFNSDIEVQYGSRRRVNSNLSIQKESKLLYSKIFYEYDNSLSAISDGDEKDVVKKKGISLGFQKEFTNSHLKIDAYGIEAFRDIDGFKNSTFQDLEGIYTKKEIANISLDYVYKELKFSSSFYSIDRNTKDYRFNALTKTKFISKNYINSIEWKRDNFIIGLESDNQRSYADKAYSRSINTIYAIKDIDLTNDLSVSVSTRLETLKKESNLSYAFGVVQNLSTFSRISFNYSSGFKRASFYQLNDSFSGNDKLSNETTQIFDLSYQYKKILKVSLFLNQIENQIDYSLVNFRYENSDKEISKGIEAKAYQKIGKLNFELGTSVFDTNEDKSRVGYFVSSEYQIESITYFSRFNYIDNRTELGNKLDDYSLLYLGAQKSFDKLVVSISVFNALNENYEETNNYETLGRNFELKAKYNF